MKPILTTREAQVLSLTAQGNTRRDVAVALQIGEETVKAHLDKARRKLGAKTTPHAIALAIAAGLMTSAKD